MAGPKFPNIDDIAWGKIREIRVSSDRNSYSFEFDLHGRRQKMTISLGPNLTSYTLSSDDGTPILHGTQRGREFRVIDFSQKPRMASAPKKLKGLKIVKRK